MISLLVVTAGYLAFHLWISWKMENTGHTYYTKRIQDGKVTPKVYDISHKLLPNWHDNVWISHAFVLGMLTPLMFVRNWSLFKEFLEYAIVLFFIRDITTFVTILPKYKDDPEPSNALSSSTFNGAYGKIFSGHFAIVFLASLLYAKYNIITDTNLLIGLNVLNALLILLTRHHYTIDVIVAFFVTMTIWCKQLKLNF